MEKIALLFPGQGSQFVGMGKTLFETFPETQKIFKEADRLVSNPPLSQLCFQGPEETLKLTVNAQPAIYTVSMAAHEVFKGLGMKVDFAAGHSVGEYSALAAAGVFSFAEGLRMVRKRGELMHEAGTKRAGTMAAVLGLKADAVESVCQEVSASGEKSVEVANLNTETQIVISGDPEAVKQASDLAKAKGAKRVIPLPVSGAFHSKLMEEAALILAEELEKAPFQNAKFPVMANLTGKPVSEASEIRSLLKKQVRGKVLWEDSIRFMLSQGVTTFVELEPGTLLSGLVRAIDKNVKTLKLEQLLGAAKT